MNKCRTFKRFFSAVDFTKKKFNVERGNYNYLDENHINFFKNLLGEKRALMDLSDLEKYNVDWFKQVRGASPLVLKPKSPMEISKILTYCNKERLAVSPQGGNTSVCGGATPIFDEIIISMELMNEVISLNETAGVLVCEAGCILENLNTYVDEKGLIVPLDLGAKGSCQIGGNISTNAGGLRLFRYGNLHGNVLGLEAVTAQGDIIDCLSTLKKDNTGYHLKHLFIGSEGTLGIVTKVAIQCPPKSKSVNLAFLGLQSFEKVLKTFRKLKTDLGEILSAVELLDYSTIQIMSEHMKMESPIGDYPFYLLIETSGSNQEHDEDKLNKLYEVLLNEHYILNGTVACDESKIQTIWSLREKIPEAFKKDGFVFCYDVSLPINNYYQITEEMREYLGHKAKRVFGFGHLGDANLHLQISIPEYSVEMKELIDSFLFSRVMQLKGSISAEHGIGFLKRNYMDMARSVASINLMKDLKHMFDPNGILNPYKVLPS